MKMDLIPMVMKPQMGLLNWKLDFPMEELKENTDMLISILEN